MSRGNYRKPRARVGTSGWSYDHWDGVFYPAHLPASRRLEYYASRFDTVEIDATFYRMPSEQAARRWREEVPDGFAFAAKGSRFITHFRKLAGVGDSTKAFLERLEELGEALEVVLWQLPPTMQCDVARLDAFLGGLPAGGPRHAVEFRHESWLTDETYRVLRRRGAAHVNVSSDAMPEQRTVTAGFVYVRFHGTEKYHGAYERPVLEPWAEFMRAELAGGRDVYAYFNNDSEGHAPRDAARLAAMLSDAVRMPGSAR